MSIWSKLFGARTTEPQGSAKSVDYIGYLIEARPYREGGQFQVAGSITKEVDGTVKEHRFIRADRFATLDEAAEFALMKGRQIIDQRGDRIFDA